MAAFYLACVLACADEREGVRHQASYCLQRGGWHSLGLVLWGTQHPDPEVRQRCHAILDPYLSPKK